MLGFPIAFTLMAMGVGFAFLAFDGNWEPVMSLLVQRTWSVMTNDILISVPLFVFMGYIVERANILDRLFRSIQLAAGGLPGSLAVATLLHLRAVCHRHRHRRRGGDADGAARLSGHAAPWL